MGYKPEGAAMLLFDSFGGMVPWKPINEKIVQGRIFSRKIEVDM